MLRNVLAVTLVALLLTVCALAIPAGDEGRTVSVHTTVEDGGTPVEDRVADDGDAPAGGTRAADIFVSYELDSSTFTLDPESPDEAYVTFRAGLRLDISDPGGLEWVDVTMDSRGGWQVDFSPDTIRFDPENSTSTVDVTVTVPEGTSGGTIKELVLSGTWESGPNGTDGDFLESPVIVEVGSFFDFDIELLDEKQSVLVDEQAFFDFTITNNGNTADTFILDAEEGGLPAGVSVNFRSTSVLAAAGVTKDAQAIVVVGSDASTGTHRIDIDVASKGSNGTVSRSFTLTVEVSDNRIYGMDPQDFYNMMTGLVFLLIVIVVIALLIVRSRRRRHGDSYERREVEYGEGEGEERGVHRRRPGGKRRRR